MKTWHNKYTYTHSYINMNQESLFVVLHRPKGVAKNRSAFSCLSPGEFEGANGQNTVWLENCETLEARKKRTSHLGIRLFAGDRELGVFFGGDQSIPTFGGCGEVRKIYVGCENYEGRDLSLIKHLTIIIPPEEIMGNNEWVTYANIFSSKDLETLTYVWMTEHGKKFEPSLVAADTKYGMFPKLSIKSFQSIKLEALPSEQYLPSWVRLRSLYLSETTTTIELCGIYAISFAFGVSEHKSSLSSINIPENTTITTLPRITFHGKGLELFEKQIKDRLNITHARETKKPNESHIDWRDVPYDEPDLVLDLLKLFSAYEKPEAPIEPRIKRQSKFKCCANNACSC